MTAGRSSPDTQRTEADARKSEAIADMTDPVDRSNFRKKDSVMAFADTGLTAANHSVVLGLQKAWLTALDAASLATT
ncbi:protein of unknown function (plasmid) [Cupriavidus taiwanensis]|uniref:Uncharacterized protein n=1 Tax=Cupriavidus taiwanensis TaxID=164546 RepID=A0A375HWR5_9BURK|nr:hypothetical protein CBM2591_P410020 [Cupriavidus taiwanensis]SOZ20904.1 hypothetical protein CBM2595_P390020 [Cupriavidus taiwanensis]SOZ76658.1 hypothetical protein CBM2617_P400019 [Cupriavidus taiwanensis]SPA53628.1 hypothetical protein CBM2629_P410021 [Cupriavidus taiwanensis]SPA54335.1 hypothetical protein CBM2606_P380016 [Cupriavidus taiwanensis]